MEFTQQFTHLVHSSWYNTAYSVRLFGPELAVVAGILGLLFVRLFSIERFFPAALVAALGAIAALGLSTHQFVRFDQYDAYKIAERTQQEANVAKAAGSRQATQLEYRAQMQSLQTRGGYFTQLLVFDHFTIFFRVFLLMFLLCVIYLTVISGIPDREDAPDFYVLLLGATLGMMIMASANHLLMVFMGIEMTSVPSYAMVGFLKGRRQSSEAALKYVVYGGGAAGVMLYGISLLAGLLGTAHLPEMVQGLAEFSRVHTDVGHDQAVRTLVLAVVMITVGLAFKLSIFPFHFWCPDAFEGASAEVGAFLSVASKAAAFAVLVRLCLAMVLTSQLVTVDAKATEEMVSLMRLPEILRQVYMYVGIGLGVLAALSATYGNLTAYTQKNIKRMLAYSTIAHAGYMLMAVAAMMVILNGPGELNANRIHQASESVGALLFYLLAYLFMNLGAFAIVALVRNQTFSEQVSDFAGLGKQAPVLAVCLAICLCSLIGIPPFGGFIGKFFVFYNVAIAAHYHPVMYVLLAVGVLNTVFSLFYYMRVVKVMFLDPVPEGARVVDIAPLSDAGRYALLATIPVLLLGFFPEQITRLTQDVARQLF